MPAKDSVMSVPKAAAFLGCSDVWVIRMLRAGTLQGFRLSGRAWPVPRTSVEKNHRDYLERDARLSGRKREGGAQPRRQASSVTKKAVDPAPTAAGGAVYLSGKEAARRLGVAAVTISRVARRTGIGIFVEDGRLAAIALADLERLRPHIRDSSGNSDWIANKGKTLSRRTKR